MLRPIAACAAPHYAAYYPRLPSIACPCIAIASTCAVFCRGSGDVTCYRHVHAHAAYLRLAGDDLPVACAKVLLPARYCLLPTTYCLLFHASRHLRPPNYALPPTSACGHTLSTTAGSCTRRPCAQLLRAMMRDGRLLCATTCCGPPRLRASYCGRSRLMFAAEDCLRARLAAAC